jgi:hypothetical protein
MSQKLIFTMLSGKVVYSDKAFVWKRVPGDRSEAGMKLKLTKLITPTL